MEKSAFLSYMRNDLEKNPVVSVEELVAKAGGIDHLYLVMVDIIKGFCEVGALSSPKVLEMVQPVQKLATKLQKMGLPSSNYLFLHDAHPSDAVEFGSFAPHCVRGTVEAEIVDSLRVFQEQKGSLTFYKNATNGMFGKNEDGLRFCDWLEKTLSKPNSLFLVVGDCTDLCIYQNAMSIRMLANELNANTSVYVSTEHVRTYDLPIETANQIGVMAHDADFLDTTFLYHMKLNGIEVVQKVK
ncbi:isochorismatase family protein [Risungbinella massiliensis]|uniref:isochorismatase family protein n=1 Tax=Risungbinella massiliensis TaxID=1329796 RepID=UPI0005CB9D2C|nr:isochorismatase family protein [Risungbinella massiliensis]